METIMESGDKRAIQEAIVTNFAKLLGATSTGSSSPTGTTITAVNTNGTAEDFLSCLSDAVADSAVVCTLPSLEMPSQGKASEAEMPLPRVGETHRVPEMAASVLDGAVDASGDTSKAGDQTSQHMGTITSWTKSTLVYAPQAAHKNISTAFSTLVGSRVRAWTLLLLRHSLNRGDNTSRSCLMSMLSSSIDLRHAVTAFKTLPLPESAYSQPKDADVVLPLLFEAELRIAIQGREDTVALRCPGTISGHFAKASSPGLTMIELVLDTKALLDSMVEQARLVVFKAVARSAPVAGEKLRQLGGFGGNNGGGMTAGFSSALNLPEGASVSSARLQKAKSSALRLNSILQGKTEGGGVPLSKTRKQRSVQWQHPLDLPSKDNSNFPNPKRQRQIQSQARLRSMKSFGRPHAEQGHGPMNATFNDFGRPGGPTWGRDGKLLNHPVPGGGMTSRLSGLKPGSGQGTRQNATFDFNTPRKARISPGLSASLNFSHGSTAKMGGIGGLPSTLPRTATALESWLVNKAQGS